VSGSAARQGEAEGVRSEAAWALEETEGLSRAERRTILLLATQPPLSTDTVAWARAMALCEARPNDFRWPEFDRWQAVFAAHGIFPPLWNGLERRPHRKATASARSLYQQRKLFLLIDWLYALGTTRAECVTALARYSARGLQAVIARQTVDVSCPACAPLHHEHLPRASSTLPPFHPGCRCLVLASPPPRPPRLRAVTTPRRAPSSSCTDPRRPAGAPPRDAFPRSTRNGSGRTPVSVRGWRS
jgi:hypothetical protein